MLLENQRRDEAERASTRTIGARRSSPMMKRRSGVSHGGVGSMWTAVVVTAPTWTLAGAPLAAACAMSLLFLSQH